ncbi:redoxin domain-containing protein [Oscillatoria amoena NRMC-F 0135]|nr:redoxin domain-containing protein [Oscillatoria amoena NRMC-F 0135]
MNVRILPAVALLGISSLLVPSMIAGEIAIGDPAPKMKLIDMSGKTVEVAPAGKTTVVTFVSTQCPISNDYNDRMIALYKDYSAKGVHFLFVNSNSTEPADVVAKHKQEAGFPFDVHKDIDAVDLLGASVTPESYVFDKNGKLVYHGYIDDSRNAARIQNNGLRDALDAVLAGKPVAKATTKAFGCTIKKARKS